MSPSIVGNYTLTLVEQGYCGEGVSELTLNLSVEEKITGFFELKYIWDVVSGHPDVEENVAFPFPKTIEGHDDYDHDGIIVSKNEMTVQMICHLIMPDHILHNICGTGTVSDYRAKIMRALAKLWD